MRVCRPGMSRFLLSCRHFKASLLKSHVRRNFSAQIGASFIEDKLPTCSLLTCLRDTPQEREKSLVEAQIPTRTATKMSARRTDTSSVAWLVPIKAGNEMLSKLKNIYQKDCGTHKYYEKSKKLMSLSILNVKLLLCHYSSINVLRSLIKSGFGVVIWAATAVSQTSQY